MSSSLVHNHFYIANFVIFQKMLTQMRPLRPHVGAFVRTLHSGKKYAMHYDTVFIFSKLVKVFCLLSFTVTHHCGTVCNIQTETVRHPPLSVHDDEDDNNIIMNE